MWRAAFGAMLTGAVLFGLWSALPWLLAMRLSAAIGAGDGPALLRQIDAPAASASLRAGLRRTVPPAIGSGADRFLGGMAERMATSWETPEGLSAWLRLRMAGAWPAEGVTPLSTLRTAHATGLASFRVEYGPLHGEGGIAFDMAWHEGAFRVRAVRFLDPPSRPWPGTLVAMR